jgi:hypothetical protein
VERIKIKMGEAQFGLEENKKGTGGGARVGKWGVYCCFAKVYSWVFARARFLNSISFFFRLIGC